MLRLVLVRLRWALAIQAIAGVVATTGYVVLADYGWFDALYMTVITLGTIGYGEVRPLDTVGRIWTIGVIVSGFAMLAYSATVLTSLFLSGELREAQRRQRSEKMRERLNGHVIVSGFGRVGRAVVQALQRRGIPCAVVDPNPAMQTLITEAGALAVTGDAMEEDALMAAGVERARAVVAAAPDDPTNLVVVLTARALRPDIRTVARLNNPDWHDRIARAGADVVMSPYSDFGAGLAASAVGPDIVGLHAIEGLGMRTEEIAIGSASPMVGRTLRELSGVEPYVLLIGLRREKDLTRWHQVEGEPLAAGDVVIALGPSDALLRLEDCLRPGLKRPGLNKT